MLQGDYYTENMCLDQILEPSLRKWGTGSLCVKEQKFLLVDKISPDNSFSEMGVMGLAPSEN